ncbi:SOS response-associated peptidase [Luteibacter mycovicinus]|uniref:SOS response-associated peptidase n=1 Tax=Luteibacter mycovicinus TaxID=1500890 RepID=UPI00055D1A5E|nr:SOS response-associated peptidase [Luteibacter sp. 9143a]
MCGRYATFGPVSLSREGRDVLDRLELDIVSEIDLRDDQFNIAPTQKALVIASGKDGYAGRACQWGLVPSWAKDMKIGSRMINARAEGLIKGTTKAYTGAFKKRRCLVPASGYFEWKGEAGAKQPYFIHDPAGHLLMFAGLWEAWRSSPAEQWVRTFAIVTGEPGKVSGDIHDRQPVILPPDLWRVWVEGAPGEASATLTAAPEADLVYHPVPKAVGSPRNNRPELVEPIAL